MGTHLLAFRVQGFEILPLRRENRMETNMDHEMDIGATQGLYRDMMETGKRHGSQRMISC